LTAFSTAITRVGGQRRTLVIVPYVITLDVLTTLSHHP
jgi:hypothetical protein